jgi:hypothetical protein
MRSEPKRNISFSSIRFFYFVPCIQKWQGKRKTGDHRGPASVKSVLTFGQYRFLIPRLQEKPSQPRYEISQIDVRQFAVRSLRNWI